MASKKAVREAFYAELETAVPSSGNSGHVPSDHITDEHPEDAEDIPAITHSYTSRRLPINEASDAPTRIERDNSGNALAEYYGTLRQLQFAVEFNFFDDQEQEACYEAVLGYFEKFDESPSTWDPTTIQSDVEWVDVLDSNSRADEDINPTKRGDRLLIRLTFQREHRYPQDPNTNGDPIQQVDQLVDADNDGTTDATWSTT